MSRIDTGRVGNGSVHRRAARSAFTLMELLVVIGIIGVLVALTFAVGSKVLASGKQTATASTIKVLDLAMKEYIHAREQPFPGLVKDPGAGSWLVPMVDGVTARNNYNATTGRWEYSVAETTAWFVKTVAEVDRVEASEAAINSLNPKTQVDVILPAGQAGLGEMPGKKVFPKDAWGNRIRLVHPRFDGIITNGARTVGDEGGLIATTDHAPPPGGLQPRYFPGNIRRNWLTKADRDALAARPEPYWKQMHGDSDGGLCPGAQPYFYSAGPDGDPSTREDNVYSTVPNFAKEE